MKARHPEIRDTLGHLLGPRSLGSSAGHGDLGLFHLRMFRVVRIVRSKVLNQGHWGQMWVGSQANLEGGLELTKKKFFAIVLSQAKGVSTRMGNSELIS